MAKSWYVVHTYSGYENKVEKYVRLLMEAPELAEVILDIKVPAEDVVELKDGKKKVTSKKFLPGYVLVEMDLPNTGWEAACSKIRDIQGVTGFVGARKGFKPQPISKDEARAILQKAGEIKSSKTLTPRQSFTIGETIKITDGPFDTFTGTIEEINTEKAKLKVMVGIFGRATPVELNFSQVEKL